MKIERKEPEFLPITITLETQDEVDQMFAMGEHCGFNNVSGSDIASEIFDELGDKVLYVYSSSSSIIFD